MKKIIVLLILSALFLSCVTMDTDLTPEQARVVEVIDCPGIDKDRLFIMANSWAVDRFVSADSVIEFSDKGAGIIKGKYVKSFKKSTYSYKIRSTLTIEVKDGAARITIANPYYRATSSLGVSLDQSYCPIENVKMFNEYCVPEYLKLIASFKKAMQETGNEF